MITNAQSETTSAYILKGNRERVFRHASSLIPIMQCDSPSTDKAHDSGDGDSNDTLPPVQPKRAAAGKAKLKIKALIDEDLI